MDAKSFGLSALIVGLLAIIVPIVTIYVVWFSLILAAVGGLRGDKVYPLVATIVNLINLVFLSPATWLILFGENKGGESFFANTTIVLFFLPIAAMILYGLRGSETKNGGVQ